MIWRKEVGMNGKGSMEYRAVEYGPTARHKTTNKWILYNGL